MSDWIHIESDERHITREKKKARELRKTNWWKRKISEGKCYYCKQHFDPKALTMDHKIPLSRGGKSKKGNLVPSCKKCNNEKKYLTPFEMELEQLRDEKENNG